MSIRRRRSRTAIEKATRACTPQEKRFVEEYIVDLKAREAALRAGLAESVGPTLLRNEFVLQAIEREFARRSTRAEIYADDVLECWESARKVDYNEFVEGRVICCRFCWGFEHSAQYSYAEIQELRKKHLERQLRYPEKERVPFDDSQYDIWDKSRPPMRVETDEIDCPACGGQGELLAFFKDTRNLSRGARYIYQGLEVTQNGGIKLSLAPRKQYDEMVGRHLGLFGVDGKGFKQPGDGASEVVEIQRVIIDVEHEVLDEASGRSEASPERPAEDTDAESLRPIIEAGAI